MKYLDLTFPSPAENLACDEALLDACDERGDDEILRVWEPSQHFVVLGYANKANQEVNLSACQDLAIPVLRRCSGGGTVLQGPGCLNYSLLLQIGGPKSVATISEANAFIMGVHQKALASILDAPVSIEGHTDLAIRRLKFSGNAQRRRKRFLLFHGTFLLDVDLGKIEQALRLPSKQPTYRHNRSHTQFLVNLGISARRVKEALFEAWHARQPLLELPNAEIQRLARDKYSSDEWTFRFR